MTRLRLFSPLLLLSLVFCSVAGALAQSTDRTNLEKEIQSLIDRLKAKEAQLFEPSADDRTAFAEFLRQPHAGLTRLMPREK
jgi:CHASE1-domain containing sensor protein